MYVVVMFSLCVLSNWISYPMFSRCSATADFVWPWRTCLVCSWHPISMILEVWPTCTLPHSHKMQCTPDVLRPRLLLISLNVIEIFLIGMWMFLMLCVASSLLIVLDVKCWYRSQATPIGFSEVNGLFLVCRAY